MVIFRAIYASWPRRIQFAAFAGLTSLSILAGNSKCLRAEWFSLKKGPARAETAEPRANEGFDKAIRTLLKEANRLENKGELDQAIILADRAAKIAEESSSLVKVSSDISSSAISEYANSLRKKKQQVELGLRQTKKQNSNTSANVPGRSTNESSDQHRQVRSSRVKSQLVVEPAPSPIRSKDNPQAAPDSTFSDEPVSSRPESRRNYASTTIENRRQSPQVPVSEFDDLSSTKERTVENVTTRERAAPASTIVASDVEPPFEPFVEDEPRPAQARNDIRSLSPGGVSSEEVIQTQSVNAQPAPENVTLISSSSIDSEPLTHRSDSPVVKLRYRYRETETQPTALIDSTGEERTQERKSKVTTAAIETDGSSSDQEEPILASHRTDEFPTTQVKDLRAAVDPSSAINQSETRSTSIILKKATPETEINEEYQFTAAKSHSPFRIRRTLKLRNTYSVLPLLTPVVARTTREPIVGRTSIVHWRPAKAASSIAIDDVTSENELKTEKSAVEIRRMQSDNDRSLIDHVSAAIRHSSGSGFEAQTAEAAKHDLTEESTTRQSDEGSSIIRREIRGSLWDQAAVPTFEGTWKPAKSQPENVRTAPLPPKTNRVEQTAFVRPDLVTKRDLRTEINRDSFEESEQAADTSLESNSTTAEFAEARVEAQPDQSDSWMDDAESIETVENRDSIQQTSGQTGLPESTVSTILGAFGVALLITGIWMVRATAGIKHD